MKNKQTRFGLIAGAIALLMICFAPINAQAGMRLHGTAPSGTWQPGDVPFAASSPANTLLPSGFIYAPLNLPVANGFNYYADIKDYIDLPNLATAPIVSFTTHDAPIGWPGGTQTRQMTSGMNGAGHLGAASSGDLDNELLSVIGNNAMSAWVFQRTSDTTATGFSDGVGAVGFVTDIVHGSGFGILGVQSAGVVAALASNLVGLLTKEEWTKHGAFNHVVAFCGLSALVNVGQPLAPAIQNDGGSTNGLFTESNLLTFPPGTSQPSGSPKMPALFTAIKNYGLMVVDNGGANELYLGLVYDQTNLVSPPAGQFNGASNTSWNSTDLNDLISDFNTLGPMLVKVGPVLDGAIPSTFDSGTNTWSNSIAGIFAPQLQTIGYSGAAMHVTRDSGGSQDINFTAAPQSLLDTASIASFGSGTTVRAATYYSQSGGVDFVSAGSAAPVIYASGALKTMNGQPAPFFDGTGANYFKATGSSANYPNGNMYFNFDFEIPDYAATYTILSGDTAGCLELVIAPTTGLPTLRKNGGATIATSPYQVPVNEPILVSGFYNSDDSYSIWLNGVPMVQGTGSVSVTAANIQIGAGPSGANPFKGYIGNGTIGYGLALPFNNPQFTLESYLKNFWSPLGTIVTNSTTLDPTKTTPQLAYSNGNLTVFNTFSSPGIAFGTVSKSSGSFYNEVLVNAANGVESIGIANAAFTSTALYFSNGQVKVNGTTVATLATWTSANTVRMAVTLGSIIEFAVDGGSLTSESISGLTSGPYFPVLVPAAFGSQLTANFGATAWENITNVPGGFGMWQ